MRNLFAFITALLILLAGCQPSTGDGTGNQTNGGSASDNGNSLAIKYPETAKGDSVDTYHGKEIADPYRWLEDDSSDETKAWVREQNRVTFRYLDNIPYRDAVQERLSEIWNYERYSLPFKRAGRQFYFKNDGLQNQSVLYEVTEEGEKVLLDPNKLSDDGTTSLGTYSFSKDGKYFGYGLAEGGSDWRTIYVKDLDSGKELSEKIKWVKFSGISWFKDGFFYSRYPAPKSNTKYSGKNEFHKVYYHKMGTPDKEDILICDDKTNPQTNFYGYTTEDESFLIIYSSESTSGNALFFKDLRKETPEGLKKNRQIKPIVTNFDNDHSVIDNIDDKLIISTNLDAPNKRVVLADIKNPSPENWKEIIAETEDVIQSVSVIGGKIIARYISNASSKLKIFGMDGQYESEVKLPGIGTVNGISGKKDEDVAYYNFTSYTRPNSIYEFNIKDKSSKLYRAPKINFPSEEYVTKQITYKSYDGTEVPLYITHKKGLKMDGKRPTLLYGYGGFNISILPQFNLEKTIILENDGVYAVANIRGGGEFGKKWHKAGTLGEKQNVFNDFQAAAEYLIDQGITSSDKLAIEGRSNGGLLVGACMTQRPDLYQVALPAVGVLDMLRYHKFTIGWAWATDYGRSDNPEHFPFLMDYSPLHNVKPNTSYPATLITTADHDDRVVPAHSFKFAATLQENHKGINPVLIRIETSAGHGAGKSTKKQIEEAADKMAFTLFNMGEDVMYED